MPRILERIAVHGVVQGVGFRPFVYLLAREHGLTGQVENTAAGVSIEVEGDEARVDRFVDQLSHRAPSLARIEQIERRRQQAAASSTQYTSFSIQISRPGEGVTTLAAPDAAACNECLEETFTPGERRFLYPFTNCTNCGPRYTIIRELPYDRPNTSMDVFPMCVHCEAEYNNPHDRRFHAQPVACPECGPKVQLFDDNGAVIDGDPVVAAVERLRRGQIVAVKGLGGFHLAVDACSGDAVARLRQRKHRPTKPLAVMAPSIAILSTFVQVSSEEQRQLASVRRPIVLLKRQQTGSSPLSDLIAPGLDTVGAMLPYTPLHYLMFYHPDVGGSWPDNLPALTALIMTSANDSGDPMLTDYGTARDRLRGIADCFLTHDRDIHARCDDSVLRVANRRPVVLRRARGFGPLRVQAADSRRAVMALGGHQKTTVCLWDAGRRIVTPHIGDLDSPATYRHYRETIAATTSLNSFRPDVVVCDQHPDYRSTTFAEQYSAQHPGVIRIAVQHHHAHIASVMAEHQLTQPVIGLAMDGTGLGDDGAVWGGEFLLCDRSGYRRVGRLHYVPMPGGEAAIREPWRMAVAYLRECGVDEPEYDLRCWHQLPAEDIASLNSAVDAGLNAPPTSSLGRLFDGVASILDICHTSSYEGEAAALLEGAASGTDSAPAYSYEIRAGGGTPAIRTPSLDGSHLRESRSLPATSGGLVLDFLPTVAAIAGDIRKGRTKAAIARRFHDTIAHALTEAAVRTAQETGVGSVALSGGCWQNALLLSSTIELLSSAGLKVYVNRDVPPNDGGLSLGQACVAAAVCADV